MKNEKKQLPWSTIIMLALIAIAMIVFIVIFLAINPANISLKELITAITICSVILVACIMFIIYFLKPQKTKENKLIVKIEGNENVEEEKILWQGCTNKVGAILLTLKIDVVACLIAEILVMFMAVFIDVGIPNKCQAALVLQPPVLFYFCLIFFLCFIQLDRTIYTITNERIYIISGGNLIAFYSNKDIIDFKIKYAFYEQNKQHGTVKIKLLKRRFAPLKNHLYSISKPENVYDILHMNLKRRKSE